MHPVHNFAFVQYSPETVHVATASAQLSSKPATPGDKVTLLGLSSRLEQGSSAEVVSRQTAVKDVAWQKLNMPTPPRYQQQNLELVRVMDTIRSDGGVLVDDSSGAVVALWSSFFYQRGGSRPAESQFGKMVTLSRFVCCPTR